ncbi:MULTISPECIES: hypothetical protein [Olivibacter]|uniref:DUF1328 domain-containing protein n=2 Tax=Sphingobacteriaceae TaxID=84566 RepID=F4C9Q3_SPHS2|nr:MULTISPECIES: hypothetical protein [Olivibacter]QEL03191.1 hypothetical protein FKG96_20975 [Olivibacter sp. LS-1]
MLVFIAIRILFVACMIFIIGYIYGGFSRKPVLATISKVAAILVIFLFIAANIFAFQWRGNRLFGKHVHHCDQIEYRQDKEER